jgi:glycosyltransferase involved in cell wall biosynthesis
LARVDPLRVLLLLPGAFGPTGGIEMYDRLLIKGFHAIARERGGRCEALVLLDEDGQHDARYLDPDQPPPRGFSGSRPRFSAAALAAVVRVRPHLVLVGHVNFGALGLALRAAWPWAQQWYVVHGLEVWSRLRPAPLAALRMADRVLSVSDFTRRELCAKNGVGLDRVSLLPDALDPFWHGAEAAAARTRREPAAPGRTILTVGRLAADEAMKGVDQVIRALPAIARAVPDVRYVVVGDGTDRARLEGIARDEGVADRVTFRGRVSSEELAAAYASSSLFAMPSAQEGFGIVFLEAAAFGVPSIAGARGGSPEVVLDGVTGRVVEHGDVDAFAAAATALLADDGARRAMGERARRRVEEVFSYAAFERTLRGHVAVARH